MSLGSSRVECNINDFFGNLKRQLLIMVFPQKKQAEENSAYFLARMAIA